jgi:hypothetical protein
MPIFMVELEFAESSLRANQLPGTPHQSQDESLTLRLAKQLIESREALGNSGEKPRVS